MTDIDSIPDDMIDYIQWRLGLKTNEEARAELVNGCAYLEDLYFNGGKKYIWTDIDRRCLWLLAKHGAKAMEVASVDLKAYDEGLKQIGQQVWLGVLSNIEFLMGYCFRDVTFSEFSKTCKCFMDKYKPIQVKAFAELFQRASNLCPASGFPDQSKQGDDSKMPLDIRDRCILEVLGSVEPSVSNKLRKVAKNRLTLIARHFERLIKLPSSENSSNDAGFCPEPMTKKTE